MKPLRFFALASVVALCGLSLWHLVTANRITSTHTTSLEDVRHIGRLEVVRLTLKDVVSIRQTFWGMLDSEVHLQAVGEAVYTVDLAAVEPYDIATQGEVIHIRIPAPQLQGLRLDHEQSRVISTSLLTLAGAGLVDSAYRQAQAHLTAAAAADRSAAAAAKTQAVAVVSETLAKVTGKKIQVYFSPQAVPVFAPLPPDSIDTATGSWWWILGALLIGGLLVSGGLIAYELTPKK